MRRFHVVNEPGYGAQWLYVTSEPGPGAEPVIFVPEAGYGSIPGFIVHEYGPGATMVYPMEGAHLAGGWSPAPAQRPQPQEEPDIDALSDEERGVLMRVETLRSIAAASDWTEEGALKHLLDVGLPEIGREFSSGPWAEHVILYTALAAMSLRRNGAPAQELVAPFQSLSNELERRGWTNGGPHDIFPQSAAEEVMTTGPHLQRIIAQEAGDAQGSGAAAPTAKKKRFWQR